MGKSTTTWIRIEYGGYDPNLDEVLEVALAAEGFELTGTGFSMKSEQRDLTFQKRNEEKPC